MMSRKTPLILLSVLLAAAPLAGAELVSVNATGTAAGNAASFNVSLSANGRFVAFQSSATDLVQGGTSGVNIFVRDLLTGTTVLASVNEPPYDIGIPEFPHLSADGRYVAYQRSTCAFFFCPTIDIFVRDLQAGTTTLVSVGMNGQPAGGFWPVISADGRHVAFQSVSGALAPNDANGATDVFLRDLDAGATQLVSVGTSGASGNGPSRGPAPSADGRFVAFESDASDLVPNDANGAADVFVRDLLTAATLLVSVDAAGTGGGDATSSIPTISADGSRVAFVSNASNLVAVDTNGSPDVFVRDLPSGPTRLASANAAGTDSGNTSSVRSYLTPSGRFVAFQSNASDLVADDLNSSQDVFLYDVDAGVTRLVSVHDPKITFARGESELFLTFDSLAGFQVASDDGRFVVFGSSAQDLVSGVSFPCGVSPCYQAYLRDLQAGTTQILSATPAGDAAGDQGQGSGFALGGQISADGRVVAFQSPASNLSSLPDTNNANDIFSVGAPQAPPPPPAPVPTLSEAGLSLLALLMAGLGLRAIRK